MVSECVFARFGSPLEKQKLAFCMGGLQNPAFQDVAFQHRLETSLGEIWEAKLGLSLSQVGLYKGSKRHVKVTSKLSCFFIEIIEFWTPQGGGGGLGTDRSGDMR